MHANNHQDSTHMLSDLERDDAEEWKSSEATWLPVTWLSPQRWQFLLHFRAMETAFCRLPDNELPSQQVMRKTTGMDFCDSLACVRVEKAKNLLLNPNYYFSEIASELGFESLGQFNEVFKRIVGEPPRVYCTRLPRDACCMVQEL
jgi:Helix-turn-helix domain